MNRTKRKWLVRISAAIGMLFVLGCVWVVQTAHKIRGEAYAMWTAGQLVCQHLAMNDQRWPTNWGELEKTYQFLENEFSSIQTETNVVGDSTIVSMDVFLPATFEAVTNLVVIDWEADVEALRKTPGAVEDRPFRVFKIVNGRGSAYEGREPNRMVWDYLQSVTNGSTVSDRD